MLDLERARWSHQPYVTETDVMVYIYMSLLSLMPALIYDVLCTWSHFWGKVGISLRDIAVRLICSIEAAPLCCIYHACNPSNDNHSASEQAPAIYLAYMSAKLETSITPKSCVLLSCCCKKSSNLAQSDIWTLWEPLLTSLKHAQGLRRPGLCMCHVIQSVIDQITTRSNKSIQ